MVDLEEEEKVVFPDVSSPFTDRSCRICSNGHPKEALHLFRQTDLEGIKPNQINFLIILDACATLASLEIGREVHQHIIISRHDLDASLSNSLINMYGKCGSLKDAQEVFEKTEERNVISWSAMVAAYAQNSHGKEALELFTEIEMEEIKPNRTTILSILQSCSHVGLVNLGQQWFATVVTEYGVILSENHYAGMGDFLGRAEGDLDEVEDLCVNMPVPVMSPGPFYLGLVIYMAILSVQDELLSILLTFIQIKILHMSCYITSTLLFISGTMQKR